MKSNTELQKDVLEAIQWEPLLKTAEISVTAKDGIVSLTGFVDSYAKKMEAEEATKKVSGVKALIENIEVFLHHSWEKPDLEIAMEVIAALKSNSFIPKDKITILVENGCLTLGGELAWNYQREYAKNAVHALPGLKSFVNNITIKSESPNAIEVRDIKEALRRSTAVAKDIIVEVDGNKIILSGTTDSIYSKEEAGRIAWKSPGIWQVQNDIDIRYEYDYA